MKKHALNQIKEKAIKKLDAKSQERVQRQIMLFKQHLLEIKAKQEERKLAIETDVTNAINIAKTYQGDMATYNIDEIKCDILNLKKTNELMLIKLIEFLQETGKLTSDDFPILLEKIKQIGEHLGPIGQELTTTVATRTKMGVAV